MKRVVRDPYFVFAIGASALLLNSWHVLSEWIKRTPETAFTGIAHYFIDYFLYTSYMAQGANGAWIWTRHMFTNEILPPTWIYWFYTLLGKFTVPGVTVFTVYAVSLIVLGAILLMLWWRLLRSVFPSSPFVRIMAFLFITTASNVPGMGDFWFSPTPALNRLGGVPHQMFQTILLLSVILLSTHMSQMRPIRLMCLICVSFIAATGSPIQMLLLVSAVTVATGKKHIGMLAALSLPALLGALLTTAEFSRDPILIVAKAWESSQRVSVPLWQFMLAVGPIALFVPFGVKPFLFVIPGLTRNPSALRRILLSYGTLSILAFFSPIPEFLHTASVRWLSPAAYGVIPILGALGLHEVVLSIARMTKKRISVPFAAACFLVLYTSLTVPSLILQVDARSQPLQSDRVISSLNHIEPDAIEAFQIIRKESGEGVVLTDPSLPYDVIVPVMTDTYSFTGQPVHTLYPQTKDELRRAFFERKMTDAQAKQFMIDHRIGYVLSSINGARMLPPYPFIHELYRNETMAVFRVTTPL